jgi:hypothetical protein
MTIQGLINKIFRANQTQNNTVSWSGSNGLKSIQEDIVDTIRERTFFTVPTTTDLTNQGFSNAVLCYVQDNAFYRWEPSGIPNGTTIFPANDGGVWVQETIGDTDGTVTNVSALTINSTGTDLSSTVANPTTTPVITLSVPTASAVNRGVLSPTDWSTFNGKQDAITLTTTGTSGAATLVGSTLNIPQYQSVITNPVTGTGTSGQVTYWNGTNSVTGSNTFAYTPTSQLLINNSVTASSAIARGTNITPTLIAAANNDALVGLDINPTFTNGAFTNVSNLAIRTNGNVQVRGNTTQFGQVLQVLNTAGSSIFYVRDAGDALLNGTLWLSAQNGSNFISGGQLGITSNTGTVGNQFIRFTHNNGNNAFRVLSNSNIELNPVAGNVLVGTTTDAGYKLNVNGTQRVQYGTVERGAIFTHSNGTYAEIVLGNGSQAGTGVVEIHRNGTSAISIRSTTILFNPSRLATASTFFVTGPFGGANIGTSVRLASNTIDQGVYTATSGTQSTVVIGNSGNEIWSPSSGNATYNLFSILPSINTSGTYSGIVRGFYYSPTLTSITGVTHRAIETVTGDVLLGSTSGNVGIGAAPFWKLQVSSPTVTSNSAVGLFINDPNLFNPNSSSWVAWGRFADPAFNGLTSGIRVLHLGNNGFEQGMAFHTASAGVGALNSPSSSEVFRITNTRNMIVGGTTDAGYKLDVNGTARVFGQLEVLSQNSTQGILLKHTALSTTATQIYYNSANAVTYLDTLFSYTAAQPFGSVDIRTKDSSNALTSRLYVEGNSGNVGIGTTSPTFKLQVNGTGSFGGDVALNGNRLYIGSIFGNTVLRPISTTSLQLFNANSGAGLFLDANGYVQIGQSNAVYWAYFSATGHTIYGTTNTNFFTSGNVGINQGTDAGYKLDVNGTARVKSSGNALTLDYTAQNLAFYNDGSTNPIYLIQSSSSSRLSVGYTFNYYFSFDHTRKSVAIDSDNGASSPTANASAVLDVRSTTKGFLKPRVTTTQRNAIATPATGLEVYNTTTNTEDYYNGTAWVSLQTSAAAVKSFGAWQEDTTQTAASSNTGYGIKFSTPDISGYGVNVINDPLGNATYIEMVNNGVYNIQFSLQLQNTDNQIKDVTIWLRKNGNTTANDILATAGFVSVPNSHGGTPGTIIAAWNYFVEAAAGDFFQLVWSTSDHTSVTLEFYPAGSPPPSAASAILTVNQVN